jgi:hypothetical protein
MWRRAKFYQYAIAQSLRIALIAGLTSQGQYRFMEILLFLRRKPYRRPGIPLAKIRHRLRPRVPKSSSGAQVETPQRVAPQAGFFYRRGQL